VNEGTLCIDENGQHVDYMKMEGFIRDQMLDTVKQVLELRSTPDYIKYRVSDNNNSADAAGFHRDIIYKRSGLIVPPCYTCLTYFDDTTMELIPGSHKKNYSLLEIPSLYARRKRITVRRGDLLIFHSTLLHRGIFTDNVPHRRVVQIFEVFLNTSALQTFAPYIVHAQGDERFSSWMIHANKTPSIMTSLINTFGFINAATGYGVPFRCREYAHPLTYVSSEGLRGRIRPEVGAWQPINKYVINPKVHEATLPLSCSYNYRWSTFYRQYVIYALYILCTSATICWIAAS
jgi:hypothetical protein